MSWSDGSRGSGDLSRSPETGKSREIRFPRARSRNKNNANIARAYFESLADHSPLFIGMCDMDFIPFYINEAGRRLVGLQDLDQFQHTPVREFFFPEDQDFILGEFFQRVFEEGRAETEIRFRHFKTGEAIWMTYDVFFLEDEDGKPVGLATVSREITERKRAEEALRENEERLRLFVEHAPAGVAMFDRDMRYIAVSQRWLDDYRLEGPIVGRSHYEIFPELPERWKEVHRRVLAGESLSAEDDRFARLDGTVQHLRWEALPWRTARGEIGGLMIAVEDVTASKRADQALRESEERFSAIVASAMDAIVALDAEQNIMLFNRAAEVMFGCKAEGVIGGSIDRLIPERFRAAHREHITLFGGSGATTRAMGHLGVVSGSRANGEEFPIEASISQLTLNDKRIFTVILRDITKRRRAEDALRESEERFSRFMQKLAACAWIKDEDGRYVFVNQAFLDFADKPLDRILGRADEEIFGAETAALFVENDRVALDSPSGVTTVEYAHDNCGMTRYFLVSKFAIPTNSGTKRLVGGVAIDDTDRIVAKERLKEASEKLLEADRCKDEFIATLAHELRNPLAPIRNGLHVLRRSGGLGPNLERVQRLMERQIDHLVRLVDDLLEVARISRGKIELLKERVDLASVIDHAAEMNGDLIDASGLELFVALPIEPLLLEADAVRLTQVFANLLNNAAKYTENGGSIWLKAERSGEEVIVSVRDNGIGISAEMLPRVFDLFTQSRRALGRAQGGLGIGLALSRSLVHLHGGQIEARSEGLGRGSEFTVRLPLGEAPSSHAESEVSKAFAPKSPRRILVVDDDRDVADSLVMLLQLMGADVRVAYSGEAALALVVEFKPHLALVDIGMPSMDGYETARRIRKLAEGQSLILLALSGWGRDEDRRRSMEAGFDRHFVKPIKLEALESLLTLLTDGA